MSIPFTHAFQPIIDMDNHKIFSYEILVRGENNEPAATIFKQLKKEELAAFDQINRASGLTMAASLGIECRINLNFTPGCITTESEGFVEATVDVAERLGLNKRQLILEITESEFIDDLEHLTSRVNHFRDEGLTIAIDNFGSGTADVAMLPIIQPDIIKLDMALLRNIDRNTTKQSIVAEICDTCHNLGIDIVAGGIESIAEYKYLRKHGIRLFQGYLFAEPGFKILPEAIIPT